MGNIAKRLSKLNAGKLKTQKGKSVTDLLYEQACYLRDLIQKYLDEYMDDNYPSVYKRTGKLENSIRVEDIASVRVNGNRLELCVYFDENANHGSGFGAWTKTDGDDVNVAELFNYGYEVKKDVWFKDIENFGYRKPALFVEAAIDEFNATNTLGIVIDKKTDIILK